MYWKILIAWCSGYHICLTHRRSQVRALVRSIFLFFLVINLKNNIKINAFLPVSIFCRVFFIMNSNSILKCHEYFSPFLLDILQYPYLDFFLNLFQIKIRLPLRFQIDWFHHSSDILFFPIKGHFGKTNFFWSILM